ncbi:MAG: glycosyl transferase family 2 [Flavobacterium sp.]|nr:MAG: glycosyl transferase family 2 [Flavobacterium sp.]
MFNIYIIIPAHNEELFLTKTLQSLVEQTFLPTKIIVVNDNSTDNTQNIIDEFSKKHSFIIGFKTNSEATHQPGSKVINAFNKGFKTTDNNFDIICKFDADLIFPNDYLKKIKTAFETNPTCGMVGGFCFIEKNNTWILENLTNKDHIRGALKAYRKECFQHIGGLKNTMGWDTVDELLAKYHGWQVCTDESLHVKHLKPTGTNYSKSSKYKQGEAFYKMRYGLWLTLIASLKLAVNKKSMVFFVNTMKGYFKSNAAKLPFIVSEKEGVFIRELRWKGIKKKLF